MNIAKEFPSEWLKAIDFDAQPTNVTIKMVVKEIVGKEDPKEQVVVYFTAFEKPFILNKTNSETLWGLFGIETDDWVNKTCCLFCIKGQMPGKPVTDWVRIMAMDPNAATPPAINTAKQLAAEVEL